MDVKSSDNDPGVEILWLKVNKCVCIYVKGKKLEDRLKQGKKIRIVQERQSKEDIERAKEREEITNCTQTKKVMTMKRKHSEMSGGKEPIIMKKRQRLIEYGKMWKYFGENDTICFVDGSSMGNPGASGIGYVIRIGKGDVDDDDDDDDKKSKGNNNNNNNNNNTNIIKGKQIVGYATSNEAELFAIWYVIQEVGRNKSKLLSNKIRILSDSIFALSCFSGIGPVPVESGLVISLKKQFMDFVRKQSFDITFHWVKGHIGIYGNEIADSLANIAAKLCINTNTILDHQLLLLPSIHTNNISLSSSSSSYLCCFTRISPQVLYSPSSSYWHVTSYFFWNEQFFSKCHLLSPQFPLSIVSLWSVWLSLSLISDIQNLNIKNISIFVNHSFVIDHLTHSHPSSHDSYFELLKWIRMELWIWKKEGFYFDFLHFPNSSLHDISLLPSSSSSSSCSSHFLPVIHDVISIPTQSKSFSLNFNKN
ncbi:hypothetical protein RFI_25810 [Reticulomyxa filosa]|uniref:ribonuclease H n=1 Tax=Reticulomyxa filosa TaxID=46433 RepID=X6MDR7_RETFI|nr:hypothetical protein RFI_25810 [Reticulomyxa filosa]|eukprot:ETO11567.1 hypothetical protein RFI_25810 [Reticulomyxa filosa]